MSSEMIRKKSRITTYIALDLIAASIVGAVFAIYRGYEVAIGLSVFVALAIGLIIYTMSSSKTRSERAQEAQVNSIEQFKRRLVKEGALDETNEIAAAKRFPWVKEDTIEQMATLIGDFAQVVRVEEKTYAIHRETLQKLVKKLPLKDEQLHKLTKAERQILEIARSANMIVREETGAWRSLTPTEA